MRVVIASSDDTSPRMPCAITRSNAPLSSGSDANRHGGVDVFCYNLRAYRDGRPLRNVIDWQRGY